ncbi:MAG: rod shape-determining protein MreC [Firmicutes bacterium]|nr:rod shape-determining protein MreC [Bacillota bacterium]
MSPKKNRKLWIGIALCVVLLVLTGILGRRFLFVRSGLGTVFSPVSGAFSDFGEWLDDHLRGPSSRSALLEEIQVLNKRIEELEQENRLLQSQNRRARELEELYQMNSDLRSYPQIAADVIGLSPSNYYDLLIVDRGRLDGIQSYMPVTAGGGLLGYVSTVYDSCCEITSIIASDSVVFGQINRPGGALVKVNGSGLILTSTGRVIEESYLKIELDESCSDIAVGDEIVTSSLSDVYPPGLSIGYVTKIGEADGVYIAYVKPTVDLSQVDMVLILTEVKQNTMPKEQEP